MMMHHRGPAMRMAALLLLAGALLLGCGAPAVTSTPTPTPLPSSALIPLDLTGEVSIYRPDCDLTVVGIGEIAEKTLGETRLSSLTLSPARAKILPRPFGRRTHALLPTL